MDQFYSILFSILGTIGTGLAAWLVALITNWINKKIKDKKLAKIALDTTTLVMSVVQSVYQVYVEALKKEGAFDDKAKAIAKDKALKEIRKQLTVDQIEYIKTIAKDVDEWLDTQVESTIYQLKNIISK